MKSKEQVSTIIAALKTLSPDALCSLDYEKDYELLFSVRLAAQCTDARVNLVTPALFARYPTLEAFAAADVDEVGTFVQSCGFWRAKARDIVLASQMLLRDYGGAVRSVCRAILPGHPLDAEEAEADTFYKLWRGAHLPADETHRRRLVVRTARQCAIDRYRALLRRGETLPLDARDDAELAVALECELETRELMAQIMALPPPDGELFLRRYVYGETAAQLGVHFNMPAATVRTRLHRARLALQKLLKEG